MKTPISLGYATRSGWNAQLPPRTPTPPLQGGRKVKYLVNPTGSFEIDPVNADLYLADSGNRLHGRKDRHLQIKSRQLFRANRREARIF